MKKIVIICLVFASTLTNAQENNKTTNTSTKKSVNANIPNAFFKNYTGNTTISKTEIMDLDTIKALKKNEKAIFVITSFDITLVTSEKKLISRTSKGCVLSNESKEVLKQVANGSKVYVDNIKATNSLGKIVNVAGITFNVK